MVLQATGACLLVHDRSEYIALTHAAKEAVWLLQLIREVFSIDIKQAVLYSDNQGALALTKDNSYHARTKHIDIRYHFIRWLSEQGKIKLVYCPTGQMIADALTKPLPSLKVKHFATALGLRTT